MIAKYLEFILWLSTPFVYAAMYIAVECFGAGISGVMITGSVTAFVVFLVVSALLLKVSELLLGYAVMGGVMLVEMIRVLALVAYDWIRSGGWRETESMAKRIDDYHPTRAREK